VLSNGLIPTVASILLLIYCGTGENILNFEKNYKFSIYSIVFVSSLSCCCGDTFSSELGTVLGNSECVYHIIKFRKVPKGTNGGISAYGTLSSLLGGLIVGNTYFLTHLILNYFLNGKFFFNSKLKLL